MAGREDEAQAIVADVIVEGGREIRLGMLLPGQQLGTELLMLAVQQLAAAKLVDGAPLRGGHEPGAGVVGNARLGPALMTTAKRRAIDEFRRGKLLDRK